jgi:hypothetical protein
LRIRVYSKIPGFSSTATSFLLPGPAARSAHRGPAHSGAGAPFDQA